MADGTLDSPAPAGPDQVEPQGAAATLDRKQLDRSVVRGIAWTAGARWLSQIATWVGTLVVAHILSPADYGIVAMAAVYIGLATLVNEFGLGSAIVKYRDLDDRRIAQLGGLCILFGFAWFIISIAAAYPLALFYRTPALIWVVIVLSVNFMIASIKTIPLSLLRRDLDFRTTAMTDTVQAIAQSAIMVTLAFFGFRYWTLVLGSILGSLISTVLLCVKRPYRPAWPRPKEIWELVTFGSHIVGARIGWYLYSNADFFIIGRVLGQVALGNYSFGWTIASIPVEKVSGMVSSVLPSVFSAVQDDAAAIRRYVLRFMDGIGLLTLPAAIGLALVAPDFVVVALGEKWRAAVLPLRLLAVSASLRSIMTTIPQVAQMTGLSRIGLWNSLLSAIVMPIVFIVGTRWGTAGVAAGWIIAYPVVALPLWIAVFRHIHLRVGEVVRTLWPALSSATLMALAVMLVQWSVGSAWTPLARLAVQVATGAFVYAASLFVFHRDHVRGLRQVLQRLRGQDASAPAPASSSEPPPQPA